MGDIIGSCIVVSTLEIGLNLIFFPIELSGGPILITGLYAAFSDVVVGVLTWREVNDKQTGALLIFLYLGSYMIPYFL